jgi:uncharacterized membrane protein YdjX (TVP38/TMEM64 family)
MRLVWLVCLVLALILVPFFLWEEPLTAFAARLVEQHRTAWWIGPAISGLLASDVFLPIPSSILSTVSGAVLGFLGGALANTLGMTLGCLVGYRAGRLAKGQSDEQLAAIWARHGEWTLVVTRAVPVLAEAGVLFAGVTGMPLRRFLLITTLSNAGVGTLYAAIGAFAMEWNSFLAAFLGSLLIPGLAHLFLRSRSN